MRRVARAALLAVALATTLLAAACNSESPAVPPLSTPTEEPEPTETPTPTVTPTTTPTATETPEPTPTPELDPTVELRAVIDTLVRAVMERDAVVLEALVDWQRIECVEDWDQGSPSPPPCREDEEDGDEVLAIPAIEGEGFHLRRDEAVDRLVAWVEPERCVTDVRRATAKDFAGFDDAAEGVPDDAENGDDEDASEAEDEETGDGAWIVALTATDTPDGVPDNLVFRVTEDGIATVSHSIEPGTGRGQCIAREDYYDDEA